MTFLELVEELNAKQEKDPTYKPTPEEMACIKAASAKEIAQMETDRKKRDEEWEKTKASWRQWKDVGHGFYYRQNEAGEPELMSVIPLPAGMNKRRPIKPEYVLSLFQQGVPVEQIAEKVNRTPKHVREILRRYGFVFGKGRTPTINPMDIPFGWRLKAERFVEVESEQWLLDKAESDLRVKKDPEEIADTFNKLKIKPRATKRWLGSIVKKAVADNRKLKATLASPASLDAAPVNGDGYLELHWNLKPEETSSQYLERKYGVKVEDHTKDLVDR